MLRKYENRKPTLQKLEDLILVCLNINQNIKQTHEFTMDQDFFEEGEYQQSPQHHEQHQQNQQHNDDNVWEEAEPENVNANLNTAHTLGSHNAYNSNPAINYGSSSALQVDDQVTQKIKEQQQSIEQTLRLKSNKEQEQKQSRKEAGRGQIRSFFDKKQKQKEARKQHNLEHEKEIVSRAKQLNQTPGWKKVAENVNLKLGQYKGSKQVNRMRQSIINKRQDEKYSQ